MRQMLMHPLSARKIGVRFVIDYIQKYVIFINGNMIIYPKDIIFILFF